MKAVILAGGKGTRLRPLTYAIPKPLLPVNQRPLLEHIVLHLKDHGIKDFIITIEYLGYQIKNYFGDGSEWGVNIEYSEEREPLGTAGCLNMIKDRLDSTFLLFAGDNLTKLNVTDFIKFHREKKGIATVALTQISIPVEFGIAELDGDNRINGFMEKPTFNYNATTMILCLEPSIFSHISPGFSNITDHVFPKLLKANIPIYGYPFKDYWADMGRPDDYYKINGHMSGAPQDENK